MAWSSKRFFQRLNPIAAPRRPASPSSTNQYKALRLLPEQSESIETLLPSISTPQSSWLLAFSFIRYHGGGSRPQTGLLLQFQSGATCFYPNTTSRNYYELEHSGSKGGWIHENVYEAQYELL